MYRPKVQQAHSVILRNVIYMMHSVRDANVSMRARAETGTGRDCRDKLAKATWSKSKGWWRVDREVTTH